jgi:hypothetical protein
MYCYINIKILVKKKYLKVWVLNVSQHPHMVKVPVISSNNAIHITIPSRMSSMTGHHHSMFSYIFLVRTKAHDR